MSNLKNRMMNILSGLAVLLVVFIFLGVIYLKGLFLNAGGLNADSIFNYENLVSTLKELFIFSLIIVPLILLWNWYKKKF